MAVITSFIMPFTGSALNLSIPGIGSEFGVNAETVGWMITAYMLTMAALSVPFGRWADITCRKTVLITGSVIFIVSCAGSVAAGTIQLLIATRIIQGIGAAMILGCNVPILISAYPPEMRGRALGISIGAVYAGGACGPVIGGVLNHQLGWRSIFVFAGALALAAFIVAAAKLPSEKAEGERRMDFAGSLMFALFIVLLMMGLSGIEAGVVPAFVMCAGFALGVAFVIYEFRKEDPVLDVHLFRNNIGYSMSNVAALLNYAATSASGYLISIYLQVIQGYTSQTAGMIMVIQPLIMAVLTPKVGRLSDKHSPFILSSAGMALCSAGIAVFMFLGTDTGPWYVMIGLAVMGLGFALFSSPNTNAILSCVDRKDYGAANAVVATMRSVGQTTSMVIVTIVVTFVMPGTQLTQADPEGLLSVIRMSLMVFMCMCLAGTFISLLRKKN